MDQRSRKIQAAAELLAKTYLDIDRDAEARTAARKALLFDPGNEILFQMADGN